MVHNKWLRIKMKRITLLQTTKHLNQKLPYKLVGVFGRWKKYLHSVNKKKLREQVILHEQGLEQFYNASKTEKYCLKPDWQSTFVLWISKPCNYLSWKFKLVAHSTSEQFIFEFPKKYYLRFLATDFCSNDLPEISVAHLLCYLKPKLEISVQNIIKIIY